MTSNVILSWVELPLAEAREAAELVGIKASALRAGKRGSTVILSSHIVSIETLWRKSDDRVGRIKVLRLLGEVRERR
jgi:hypothetical protein